MATLAPRKSARLAGLLVPVLLVGVLAGCLDSQEQTLLNNVNAVRAGAGAGRLTENHQVSQRAEAWAATLASEGQLRHSDLKRLPVPFTKAAENVAKASSLDEAHRLLVNSPSHRANMVDAAFTQVGIGTARGGDGMVYAVEIFVRSS
jgi:uncharacterized protein YkwD